MIYKKVIHMIDENSTFSICSICFGGYNNNKDTIVLKCGHKYHTKCILDWLKTNEENKNCAFCKGEINKFIMDIHSFNFNHDKIMKKNYNLYYLSRKPVYLEDMNINYDNKFLCREIKKQLMNAMPADFVKTTSGAHCPIYILKSDDGKYYNYISAYFRMLILFTSDINRNEKLIPYMKFENKMSYQDDFIKFDCINDNFNHSITFINKTDYYKYCTYMEKEVFDYLNKYPNENIRHDIELNTIMSDMFISNLKHLAGTDYFIQNTTLSDTITKKKIRKYKKAIYHTIALITVYGYLNMIYTESCKIFKDEIDDLEDNNYERNYEKYCSKEFNNYFMNRINALIDLDMENFVINGVMERIHGRNNNNINNNESENESDDESDDESENENDINIQNMNIRVYHHRHYVQYEQVLPSINYMYYEIMPQYLVKNINLLIKSSEKTKCHNIIQKNLKEIYVSFVLAILFQFIKYIYSYQYDIKVYSKQYITEKIIIDNHFNLDYDRALIMSYLSELLSIIFTEFMVINCLFTILTVIYSYYKMREKYMELSNVNCNFNTLCKNDIIFDINCLQIGGAFILIIAYQYLTINMITDLFNNIDHTNEQIKNLTVVYK